jgi:serine/threonine protein kinase
VFSFGLILYELLAGKFAFPKEWEGLKTGLKLVAKDERPEMPEFVLPSARELITDCWATEPDYRPSFEEIVDPLVAMKFNVIRNLNPQKLRAFVKEIEDWERRNTVIHR